MRPPEANRMPPREAEIGPPPAGRAIEGASESDKEPVAPPDEAGHKREIKPEVDSETEKRMVEFRRRYEQVIRAYVGGDIPITMKPGGWYAVMEKDNMGFNIDPGFFIGRGFSEPESLYATCHELQHILDFLREPDKYDNHFQRVKREGDAVGHGYGSALGRFYNCLEDDSVNRRVNASWKPGQEVRGHLYPKLFPENDFRGEPRHRQLGYALLLESQTGESCLVDDDVREAMDAWQKRGGRLKAIDALNAADMTGKPRLSFAEREKRVIATLEPIFKEFYLKDLVDRRPPPPQKGEGEGDGEGEPSGEKRPEKGKGKGKRAPSEDEPFGDDPLADSMPNPFGDETGQDIAKKFSEWAAKQKAEKFEELMGVSQEDFEKYRRDAEKVEPQVERMAQVWDRIIQRRKEYRRVLKRAAAEGVVLDPRKLATAVAEIKSGHLEPAVMLDFEKKPVFRNRPSRIEFSLICDGTGSMSGSDTKTKTQRLLAVLAMEGFARFRDAVAKAQREGERIDLAINSELRIFSTSASGAESSGVMVKEMGPDFGHEDRVKMRKALLNLPGGNNNETDILHEIGSGEQFSPGRAAAIADGTVKKIMVFLTDGETDKAGVQAAIRALHGKVTNTDEPSPSLVIAGIGFAEGKSAVDTYAPNGYYAENLDGLADEFIKVIDEVTEDV